MAQIKGLLKALDDRLPESPEKAEKIIKSLLTEAEWKEIDSSFFVYKGGDIQAANGNPTRGEYRFVALGNKIGSEPEFKKGFWFFTPEGEEITETTPILALRKCGHIYFNTLDDKDMVKKSCEEFLLSKLG